jgi:hypothetical protein
MVAESGGGEESGVEELEAIGEEKLAQSRAEVVCVIGARSVTIERR